MIKLPSARFGFTLIEVLVVVAIIGILVAIVSVNFTEAREQSRDKIRMSDLKQLQLALESYRSQNGRYPEMGCGTPTVPSGTGGVWVGADIYQPNVWGGYTCEEFIVGLVPEFIPELTRDLNGGTWGYIYSTDADGTSYKLMVGNENLRVTSFDNEFARCPRNSCIAQGYMHCDVENDPGAQSLYAVYSDGAECR